MQIVIASSNPHKLEEIKSVFDETSLRADWELLDDALESRGLKLSEPVEDQPTFEGNAQLKARYYAKHLQAICLADDSGLSVDHLGGAPGVLSARYSGIEGPRSQVDLANNAKLLKALQGVELDRRTARFVCCLAICDPNLFLPELVVRGEVVGRILTKPETDDPQRPERGRGQNGFGYDPLFLLGTDHKQYAGLTTAELSPTEKNAISHRGVATRKLATKLQRSAVG
jgi:XTP/dITP diphosphohydrolase